MAPNHELFVITANGFGKRTLMDAYSPHGRGTAGQLTYKITPETGPVVAARTVNASQELIVISRDGIILRTRVETISVQGRATQGVAVIGVGPGDAVASLAAIDMVQAPGQTPARQEPVPPPRPKVRKTEAPRSRAAPAKAGAREKKSASKRARGDKAPAPSRPPAKVSPEATDTKGKGLPPSRAPKASYKERWETRDRGASGRRRPSPGDGGPRSSRGA